MISGIGIDSEDIHRFNAWTNFPAEKLKKTFSDKEIEYCLQTPKKSAERFAARFAAKEAFFKALSNVLTEHKIPFLTVCKNVSIEQEKNGAPKIMVKWGKLTEAYGKKTENRLKCLVSITHTNKTATAIIIVQKTN